MITVVLVQQRRGKLASLFRECGLRIRDQGKAYVRTILSPAFKVTMAFFQFGDWPACLVR